MIAMEEVRRRWESYGQGCLHLLVSYGMGMCKRSSDGAFFYFLYCRSLLARLQRQERPSGTLTSSWLHGQTLG